MDSFRLITPIIPELTPNTFLMVFQFDPRKFDGFELRYEHEK